MKALVTLSFCLLLSFGLSAQDVFGKWKTIDSKSGKDKSLIEIYKRDGMAYGSVLKLYGETDDAQDVVCSNCKKTDNRYNQKVLGMQIIRALMPNQTEWSDGTILNPENGKVYDCKIWLDEEDNNKLYIRHYYVLFFKTQTWTRQ